MEAVAAYRGRATRDQAGSYRCRLQSRQCAFASRRSGRGDFLLSPSAGGKTAIRRSPTAILPPHFAAATAWRTPLRLSCARAELAGRTASAALHRRIWRSAMMSVTTCAAPRPNGDTRRLSSGRWRPASRAGMVSLVNAARSGRKMATRPTADRCGGRLPRRNGGTGGTSRLLPDLDDLAQASWRWLYRRAAGGDGLGLSPAGPDRRGIARRLSRHFRQASFPPPGRIQI